MEEFLTPLGMNIPQVSMGFTNGWKQVKNLVAADPKHGVEFFSMVEFFHQEPTAPDMQCKSLWSRILAVTIEVHILGSNLT